MAFDLIQISEALARNAAKKPIEPEPTKEAVIADLRERLAAADAAVNAASDRIAALEQRLTDAVAAMDKATGQTQALAAQAMQPKEKEKPVAYEVVITDRDAKGRMLRMELIPNGGGSGSHI